VKLEKSVTSADLAMERPGLSVVAPCYNEEGTLEVFVERTVAACRKIGRTYEIVLVNDGSRDKTWQKISELAERTPGVVGVNLARNYGHQLAASAGLSLARGDRVVLIDADLQDPPELVVDMMTTMDQGYDVVYAKRRKRASESAFKLATASAFYRVLASMSEVKIPTDVGDFRLMSRRIVDRLNAMPEQDRFIRGMVAWLGGRQTEVLYDRDARYAGETGYTLSKMLRLAMAGITSFSTAPLQLAVYLAGTGVVIAAGLILYVLFGFITGRTAPGWTSLGLMIAFFSVGQLFCLAIIGSYLGRVFMQVKGRPLYFVDQVVSTSVEVRPAKEAVHAD
jgi:polyisoprenyl-phosphate glycosyltransferase